MKTPVAKPRIVFFGNERIATGVETSAPILRMLIEEGYEVAAIVVNDAGTQSRKARPLAIAKLASEHAIPLLVPSRLSEITPQLRGLNASVGVLVAYGRIVPMPVIELFPAGIVNIHPSLLPKHRGSTPIESVLLAGETMTGVSLMKLARDMDAGDVYAQAELPLGDSEAKQTLSDQLADIGRAMLKELLPGIIEGSVVALPQDHAAATYDKLIEKSDGLLDFTKPAARLEREVRAFAGWPGSHCVVAEKDVVITAAHVAGNDELPAAATDEIGRPYTVNKKLCIQTGEGTLVIDRLKPAGKTDMPAAAFLAGHQRFL